MTQVELTALGPVRRSLGFNHQVLDVEADTVEEFLRKVQTEEDGSLFDFLVDDTETLKNDIALFVNEKQVKPDELQKQLDDGDKVVTMEVLRPIRGGCGSGVAGFCSDKRRTGGKLFGRCP